MFMKSIKFMTCALVIAGIFGTFNAQAQKMRVKGYNTVSTAVTFLTVSPDSRSDLMSLSLK